MELTANQKLVHQMYIAYYQRPADPQGLKYWVDQLETYQDWTVISAAFGSPENAENQALYGSKSREEVIAEIYQSAFDRAAVAEEISYWADSEHSLTNLAFAIINGAQNDDLAAVNAKVAFSQELIEQVDPAGNGLPAEYEIPFTSLDVVNMLKDVNKDTDVTPEYVEEAVAAQLNPNSVFTLTEIRTIEVLDDTIPTQTLTYWGNPETGEGVPAGQVWDTVSDYLFTAANMSDDVFNVINDSLDRISTITIAGSEDGLQGGMGDQFNNTGDATSGGDADTGFDTGKEGDYTGNYQIRVTLQDGTVAEAVVSLTQEQFEYLNGLLFDANGNSRLFEKEVAYMVDSGFDDADGNDILVPAVIEGGTLITDYPIILTPTQNNGGTEEIGKTSAADDFIVAGRLDLLHGAYIDGGEGNNTLEIDAKGYYAQPKELLNIQTINIQNLPNVYTDVSGDSTYPDLSGDGSNDSTIDLSRAVDLEKLTITESDFDGVDEATLGTLTIAGVRNGALTRFEGEFSQDVTVHYGEGLTGALNIELAIGDVNADINLLHNASTLNIDSQGTENHMHQFFAGGTLSHLNISGEAIFSVEENMAAGFNTDRPAGFNTDRPAGFNTDRPAVIDASANTGGVDLTIDGHDDEVIFTGTAEADDQFQANSNGKAVTINAGNGDNELTAESGEVVTITAGDGANTIRVDGSDTVSVTAGNGGNMVSAANVDDVTITTGEGADVITASAGEIIINSQGGDDVVTVAGREGSEASGVTASPNLVLVLDDSGSMSNGQTPAPIVAQAAAVAELFDQLPDDTAVYLVADLGSGTQPADAWVTKAQALAVVNTMQAQGYWNTAGFIAEVQTAFGDQTGTYNVGGANEVVFITDGGNSVPNEQAWIDFLVANDVRANVLGIGANDQSDIDVINSMAYDGRANADLDGIVAPTTAELSGLLEDLGRDIAVLNGNGAKVNIDLGEGNNVLVLGNADGLAQGLVAYEGSSITGENITMVVNADSDLRAATLNGITSVVLDNGDVGSADRTVDNAKLTLTAEQFLAIGAENFSVEGSIFHTYAQVEIIVTDDISLTDLGVDNLSRNIDLILEVQDGVTLEMTAEQLHTRVAPQGITLADDGNTDLAAGNVVITGAAGVFDPFNTSDTIKTNIDGNVYYGGSLSDDFKVGDQWFNVSFSGETGYDEDGNEIVGYDRPADVPAEVVYKINTGTGSNSVTDDGLTTWHTNLEITGARDITFTGPIQLGEVQGDSENTFTIDFSELEGVVSGMTIDHFEQLAQGGAIYGNGNNGYATEVLVHLAADADDNVGFDEAEANSLVSKGVARYVVTQIDGPTAAGSAGSTATIKLCDTTEDLEVMALRGNYNDTLVIQDAAWGLVFELQGGTTAKADGPTGTANVGKLDADFEWKGAAAVVNLVHSVAGDDRPLKAYGIDIDNADTLTINAEGPAAEITSVEGDDLVSLTLAAEGDLTIVEALADGINTIDASAVAGDLTVATAVTSTAAEDFSFTGSEGVTELTMTAAFVASEDSVLTSAGELNLVVDNRTDETTAGAGITVDLTRADVTDVDTVVVGAGDTLNLTVAQAYEIGPENITGADATARLQLSDLGEEPFNLNDFGIDNIVVDTIAIIDQPVVTLHPDTDLTGVTTLLVNEGTTLNLTAAQFQQLTNNGVISGVDSTTDFTVNITDLAQADVAENALVLIGIAADNVSLTLAESVVLPTGSNLNVNDGIADGNGNLTINIGDNLSLSVLTLSEMDGVTVVGGTESTLEFLATTGGDFPTNIDASGFDVDYLRLTDLLVSGNNVDYMFENLLERVTKVIYNGVGDVAGRLQNVVVEEGTTIFGDISFNEYQLDSEITHLTLNLEGGTRIHDGDLVLSTVEVDVDEDGLVPHYLQSLVINSTGTGANEINGQTANVINGDITPAAYGPAIIVGSRDNNLKSVTINADQAFELTGEILFSSHGEDTAAPLNNTPADGVTANDDSAAIATLTVTGSADVAIGAVNTTDDDIDGLTVANNGTGTLSLTIDAAKIDQVAGNTDALSFTGSNIELTIAGDVDLSDDDLSGVSQITIGEEAILTLSQAQLDVLGTANLLNGTTDSTEDEVLHIVELGSDPFDATAIAEGITVASVTIAEGTITLDPTTDLTGVGEIRVLEGSTLNLTAAQYQQLAAAGTIVGVDTDGDNSDGNAFTVNITDLTQADIDYDEDGNDVADGLDLSGIADAATVTLSLAEDVNLNAVTNLDDLAHLEVLLADGQTLGLASALQASGLNVTGGANSTLVFQFTPHTTYPGQIDASGYDVTILKALANGFTIGGNSNVEYSIDDLASTVELRLYEDPADLGFLDATYRVVSIEEGITTPTGLIFNDWDNTDEVRTLVLNLEGDVTLNGDLSIPTRTDKDTANYNIRYFDQLTINSVGDELNTILGDIGTATVLGAPNTSDNNLLNVAINAEQDLVIGDGAGQGVITFNSIDVPADDAVANLTITGAGDVTIKALDTSDTEIATLNIDHQGSGLLTVTGGSDALELTDTENLVFTGSGDIVLDTHTGAGNNGIDGADLSTIDASGHSGSLTLGVIEALDSTNFDFTSGTGTTTLTLGGTTLNVTDADGADDVLGTDDDQTGWSFDFTNAAVDSEIHIGAGNTWTAGDLNINLGANTTLYIDANTNWSALNLEITQVQDIVLADGVKLTLTAEQASGLNIVAGPDTGATGFTGEVEIIDLGAYTNLNDNDNDPLNDAARDNDDTNELFDYDFSGLQVPASATLADDDVTLSTGTDLGNVTIKLKVVDNADDALGGQTIRFATQEQADGRDIDVINGGTGYVDPDADASVPGNDPLINTTNVVWLFNSVTGTLDTSNYDEEIGRLWFTEALANGANLEELFSSLPDSIIRIDFADPGNLTLTYPSEGVDRVVELASFTNLPNGLIFADEDKFEHIQSLTIQMGGEVTLGSIELDNLIIDNTDAQPGDLDPTTVVFNTLTIDSVLADDTGDLLAADGYDDQVNNAPTAPNIIGDITIGAAEGLELTHVILNTGVDLSTNSGPGAGILTGNDLEIGTIKFAANATSNATLTVTGNNDVTIKSLDTSDPEVNAVVNIDATQHNGVLTVTGGSPAAALNDVETLNINTGVDDAQADPETFDSDVYFGHVYDETEEEYVLNLDGNGVPYAGVAGAELSAITIDGNGNVHLGVLALIDGTDDDLDDDGIADVDAFTLNGGTGTGTVTAILGKGNVDGVETSPLLEDGSTWRFVNVDLTIQETTDPMFEAGAILVVDGGSLTIDGEVDLTEVTLDLTDVTIDVPADQTLILTVAQVAELAADGVEVVGSGTVEVIGNGDDATASIFGQLRTANVDLSAVVLTEDDANDVFEARFNGGLDDAGEAIGQTITGSAFDDYIIAGEDTDDTLIGGAGNDTLVGGTGSGSSDTYIIDAGNDIVIGLRSEADDNDGSTTEEQDVLVVSAGASVTAENIVEFVATAETINNGTATLTAASGGATIDVSLAGGSNGFTLNGGESGANVLTGSANDDIINGGDAIQNGVDVLTGGLGDDRFVFDTTISTPATLAVDVDNVAARDAVDAEEVTVTASNNAAPVVGTANDSITVVYQVNNIASNLEVSLNGIDLTDDVAVAAQIATALDVRSGINAAIGTDVGVNDHIVYAEGINGNRLDVSINSINLSVATSNALLADNGDGSTPEASDPFDVTAADGTDQAQVTVISVTDDDAAVAGEVYSLLVTGKDGVKVTDIGLEDIGVQFVTTGGETATQIAQGIADEFNTVANIGVNYTATVDGNGNLVITDDNEDDGGFTVTWQNPTGAYQGSGASVSTDYTTADLITDFTSGEDVIELGLGAATATNFATGAEVAWHTDAATTWSNALIAANDAFTSDVDLMFYLTSVDDTNGASAPMGVLYFDANMDGTADGMIKLTGIDENSFVFGDIVA
jgi:hypothetical protein